MSDVQFTYKLFMPICLLTCATDCEDSKVVN